MENRRYTVGLSSCEVCSVYRYTESAEYRLPEATTPEQVFSFYAARLPAGWRITSSDLDCPTRAPGPASPPSAQKLASSRCLVTNNLKVVGLNVTSLNDGLPMLMLFRGEASLGCAVGLS